MYVLNCGNLAALILPRTPCTEATHPLEVAAQSQTEPLRQVDGAPLLSTNECLILEPHTLTLASCDVLQAAADRRPVLRGCEEVLQRISESITRRTHTRLTLFPWRPG